MKLARLRLNDGTSFDVEEDRFDKLYLAIMQSKVEPTQPVNLAGHRLCWNDIKEIAKVNPQESLHEIFTRKKLTCWCSKCRPRPRPLKK